MGKLTGLTGSSVASPKIWERPRNLGASKMLYFRRITLFYGMPPLEAQNDYMF